MGEVRDYLLMHRRFEGHSGLKSRARVPTFWQSFELMFMSEFDGAMIRIITALLLWKSELSRLEVLKMRLF